MGWTDIFKKVAPIAASFIPGVGPFASAGLSAVLGAGGSALGAVNQSQATNRDAKFSGQMDLAQLLAARDAARLGFEGQADRDFFDQGIAREEEGRAGRSSAWRGLLSAERTLNPTARPDVAGAYGVPKRQASEGERAGADAMKAEVMARLQGGNPIAAPTRRDTSFGYDPMSTIDPRLLDASGGEKATGWLSAILSGLGSIRGRQQPGGVMYTNNAPSGLTRPPGMA